ncbi:MAG: outer membrane protein assembly factor BamD, partial [Desulfobacteraceae bacterium]|nr:outer membrane protein assembly factor BamD [Desulfobacteraceae bacterium]
MKKTNILFFALLFVLFVFQGCTPLDFFGFKSEPERRMYNTAEQLIEEGAVAFDNKDYKDALKAYTQLKDWYPFSRYAILAELRIADSHYELEEYDEAIFAYTDFEELHPKNDAIARVIYRRGLCWHERMDTIDRDNRPAGKAIVQFNRLKERFPDSAYVSKVDKMIVECTNNIAGHELYVAEFYYKSKNYKASLN